jgi:hypothetical protein
MKTQFYVNVLVKRSTSVVSSLKLQWCVFALYPRTSEVGSRSTKGRGGLQRAMARAARALGKSKWLIFITSKTLNFPSPTCGRGSPAGAGEGALAGKSTLVPNPLPPVGEGTNSSVFGSVSGAKIQAAAHALQTPVRPRTPSSTGSASPPTTDCDAGDPPLQALWGHERY